MGSFYYFCFRDMCWLGLHVHSDNSAVVSMLSRWSARPVCVLCCLYVHLSLITIGCSSLLSIINFRCIQRSAKALARSKVNLFPSLTLHIPWPLLDPFVNRLLHWVDRLDHGGHGYLE